MEVKSTMARKIQAVTAYRPRIRLGDPATEKRFYELVSQRTTLSPGLIVNVHEIEIETLIGLLLEGRPVHTGVAIFTPSIDLDGDVEIKIKLDQRLLNAVNANGAYNGRTINAENIGKTSDELVMMWNTDHPEDPVV